MYWDALPRADGAEEWEKEREVGLVGGLEVIELFPRMPCGMPIVPGELRGGHPWLAVRGPRDWVGLVGKGMEITDSICRAGDGGTAPRTGMLGDRGCLVDMRCTWMNPGGVVEQVVVQTEEGGRMRRMGVVELLICTRWQLAGYKELDGCHSQVTIVSRDHVRYASLTPRHPTIMVRSQSSPSSV